jgi:hypothetical protein
MTLHPSKSEPSTTCPNRELWIFPLLEVDPMLRRGEGWKRLKSMREILKDRIINQIKTNCKL